MLVLGACSIEGARQIGDTCLSDRECASPLRCELTATGSMRCVSPVSVDAAVAEVGAVDAVAAPTPDAGAGVDAVEAATAAPDAQPVDDMIDAGD